MTYTLKVERVRMANRHFPERRSRIRFAIAFAVLAIIVALAVDSAIEARTVLREASTGRTELVRGAEILKTNGLGLSKAQVAEADRDFLDAARNFLDVDQVVSGGLRGLVLKSLPIVGPQASAAGRLSDMGVHLARIGSLAVQALGSGLVEAPTMRAQKGPGEKVLALLKALDPRLPQLQRELDLAVADRKGIPNAGLFPPLASAVEQLDSKLNLASIQSQFKVVLAAQAGIRRMLGANQPQTYLVLQQDPAELRPTGGFIGSVGFLTFTGGKLAPFEPADVYTIDRSRSGATLGLGKASTGISAPAPLAKAFGLNSLALRDSNWSPDFPTSAREAELLLERETGRRVDGVIAIDPFLIQELLGVLGPVRVPETGDIVTSSNFFATTLNKVELNQATSYKSFLSYSARAILGQLMATPAIQWLGLLQAFGQACATRSLQAYFPDTTLEAMVDKFSCGGELKQIRGDGLMVVDSNLGANKDDFWLQRSFALQIQPGPDGGARHQLRLHYSGLTPHELVLTQYRGYTDWLRIYLPDSAKLVDTTGASLNQSFDLGRQVIEGWLFVPFYKTVDVTITYDVAAVNIQMSGGRFELLWQKQAGRTGDPISVQFVPPKGSSLRGIYVSDDAIQGDVASTNLSVDRIFSFRY